MGKIFLLFVIGLMFQQHAYAMVSNWSPYSECDATCDFGTKERTRTCEEPPCSEALTETQYCFLRLCIVEFDGWSDWSDCSMSCGSGISTRTRECLLEGCTDEVETESCSTGCRLTECPTSTSSVACHFENGMCGFTSESDVWQTGHLTSSTQTGPLLDHTMPDGCGNFLYFEASDAEPETLYEVISPVEAQIAETHCLSFFVNMFSEFRNGMGSAAVFVTDGGVSQAVWNNSGILNGDRNYWHHVMIDIYPTSSSFTISFAAIRGSNIFSDVAIDDVDLTVGECDGPVDGNWAPWNPHTDCSNDGGPATLEEFRTCTSPPRNNYGKDCVGPSRRVVPCMMAP